MNNVKVQTKEEKILAWKKRVELWANSESNVCDPNESYDVNYHWGFHAGMVSMAKEALEIMKLLDSENETVTFNLNNVVFVKLTEAGLDELRKQHEELIRDHPHLKALCELHKPDDDGYYKFQGWELMKRFGHMMGLGFRAPFEMDIKIRKRDLYEEVG